MSFQRKQNKSSSKSKSKNSNRYIKVANIWPSKDYEGQVYVECDDYFGELLFRDKKTGSLYKVDYMNLFEPKVYKNQQGKTVRPPEGLLFNMCVNPGNKQALSRVSSLDDLDSDTSEDSDFEEDDANEYKNSPSKNLRRSDIDEDSESDSEESSEDEQE